MFSFIKRIKDRKEMFRQLNEILNDSMRDEAAYIQMDTDELFALSDDELYRAAEVRTSAKVDQAGNIIEELRNLSDVEKNFYVCQYFDMEVMNGGLCQFFVNSSRMVAPLLSDSLRAVGAMEHQRLFDGFVKENQINLTDLDSFMIDREDEYEAQSQRYPFDAFDEKLEELTPLTELLVAYIRSNIRHF